MIETIDSFIHDVFSNEFIDNVRKSISLFEAFEYQNAYFKLIDIITDESVSSIETRADQFVVELTSQLDFIVKEHLIQLTSEATIKDRLIILDALFRLQHLEDYTAIVAILSSEDDDVDKMSRILEEVSEYDQGQLLTLLESVDRRSLTLLNDYIEDKTKQEPEEPVPSDIIHRVRLFNEVLGHDHIGYVITEAGMRLGYPFLTYLPYVKDHLVQPEPEKTALNILSILYLSNTKEQDFLNVYRSVSEDILPSLDLVSKTEGSFIKLISKIEDIKKVQHEQG